MISQSLTDTVFGRRPDAAARLAVPPMGVAPAVDGGAGEAKSPPPVSPPLPPALPLSPLAPPDPQSPAGRALDWLHWASSALASPQFFGTVIDVDGDAHPVRETVVRIIEELAQPKAETMNAAVAPPSFDLLWFAALFRRLCEGPSAAAWTAGPDQRDWFPDPSLPGSEFGKGKLLPTLLSTPSVPEVENIAPTRKRRQPSKEVESAGFNFG